MTAPDKRLSLCAEFVRPGARLADIGTDHAYLPVWLCQNGICPSAIAADINPEPLSRGAATIAAAGMEGRVTARLSDGLAAVSGDEVDDIVIAGMGGELITRIIGACAFARDPDKRWILQPMTKSEALIRWLSENGYGILRQDCCVAAGKCYTVICAAYMNKPNNSDELYPYLGELSPRNNKTHLSFVEGHIDRLSKMARGDARFAVLAERLKEACCDDRR